MNVMWESIQARTEEERPEGAHGTIQWKGTQVCVDLHCTCGTHSHVDAEFFYRFKCPHCRKCFFVGNVVQLTEALPEEIEFVEKHEELDFILGTKGD